MLIAKLPDSRHRWLIAYFRSGWAFLIPYLAAYLVYDWAKWPANPRYFGSKAGVSSGVHAGWLASFHWLAPIPLLYVYWGLHVLNAVLAVLALRVWWHGHCSGGVIRDSDDDEAHNAIGDGADCVALPTNADLGAMRGQRAGASAVIYSAGIGVAPWVLLALVFYIPGLYLEWPSDPWEHLRRIAEWGGQDLVGFHSAGYKTQYFLAYSIVSWCSPARMPFWLNFYYTGVCLLLAWQYYSLAKAVGLNNRWAFLSVVVNILTFGNVCFSFYRYYGLATTMFMQIGVVAITRTVIAAARKKKSDGRSGAIWGGSEQPTLSYGLGRGTWGFLGLASSCFLLLVLVGYSHIEGLALAGLSIGAIMAWRLIDWKARMALGIVGALVALNLAVVLWWPRHPWIDSSFRPTGWINVWYGFNLFTWPSPAADRAMQILGLVGVMNLVAGLILLRRNSVVGWLTVGPIICLGLPIIAIPLAGALSSHDQPIFMFSRLLYAIPSGLALTVLAECCSRRRKIAEDLAPERLRTGQITREASWLIALGAGVAMFIIPANKYSYSRVWHLLALHEDSLDLGSVLEAAEDPKYLRYENSEQVLGTTPYEFLLGNRGTEDRDGVRYRVIDQREPPSERIKRIMRLIYLGKNDDIATLVLLPSSTAIPHSGSLAGFLSGHWLSNDVALEFAGIAEVKAKLLSSGYRALAGNGSSEFFYSPSAAIFLSPIDGATCVQPDAQFEWRQDPDVQAYYLSVGLEPRGRDILDTGEIKSKSYSAVDLPVCRTLYATLWRRIDGRWYAHTASFKTEAPLIYPYDEAKGVARDTTFKWHVAANAQAYYLYVGSRPGDKDIVDTGELQGTSYTVHGLPSGRTLYAAIWRKIGSRWYSYRISFTTQSLEGKSIY